MLYIAFLRGIMPGNPNMSNEKLRNVFAGLGFSGVQSVISSGNIIFESNEKGISKLEAKIQAALQAKLGIEGLTIIRSQKDINNLIKSKSFGDQAHDREHYQLVTFFKTPLSKLPELTDQEVIQLTKTYICTQTDVSKLKTPDFMAKLEKLFSKNITSRTMKTIQRIAAKINLDSSVTKDSLPNIGRPATSALAELGVFKASQLKNFTQKDLLALHGVGPKAIKILHENGIKLKDN